MNHNRPISRPLLLAVEAPCRAHSPAHFFTLAWISQQRSLQTMSSMPDVRAAASSLPWRNAQPTPPPVAVPPTTTTTPPPPSGHLHRIQDLVGYTAVLPLKAREKNLAKERVLGVVKEVINATEAGASHPLLKIVSPASPLLLSPTTTTSTTTTTTTPPLPDVEHLIPLVRSIVPRIDPGNKRLLIDPPAGLLELGRRKAILIHLRQELTLFATAASTATENNTSISSTTSTTTTTTHRSNNNNHHPHHHLPMPVRRELEAAHRKDLVKLIQVCGGFIEVAQELGFKSVRRPPGYWEDEAAMDRELSLFVAANWVRFEEGSDEALERASFMDPSSDSSSSEDDSECEESSFLLEEEENGEEVEENFGFGENEVKVLESFLMQQQVMQPLANKQGSTSSSSSPDARRSALMSEKRSSEEERKEESDGDGSDISTTTSPTSPMTSKDRNTNMQNKDHNDEATSRDAEPLSQQQQNENKPPHHHQQQQQQEQQQEIVYWYNQVTRKVRWTEPPLPQTLDLDDQGSILLTESAEDRAMPSRSALFAAGRYDLHAAIVAAGGYGQVAEDLNRYPAWPPTRHLRSLRTLATELREVIAEHGLPRQRMPSKLELLSLGRGDLHQAVTRHGGYPVVAEKLRWRSQRRQRGAWKDVEATAAQVLKFAQEKAEKAKKARGGAVAVTVERMKMPTHQELRAAGRHDLRHALQQLGSEVVAEAAGLQVRRAGLGRGKKRQERLDELFVEGKGVGSEGS